MMPVSMARTRELRPAVAVPRAQVSGLRSHDGLYRRSGPKVPPGTSAKSLLDGSRLSDAGQMSMRFPRRRAKNAGRVPDDRIAETPPDDWTDWSRPRALGVRACCCPARPVVRVRIPRSSARPHSVALLLCGHHYRMSCAALAAVGAVIIDDRRGGPASASMKQAIPGSLVPRRGDDPAAPARTIVVLSTAGAVMRTSFRHAGLRVQAGTGAISESPVNQKPSRTRKAAH